MKELRNDIINKSLGSLYLFTGEEKYLIGLYEKAIINAYLSDFGDMNLSVFEGKQVTAGKITDATETMPFFCEKRIVIVRGSELLATGRKAESDIMADYLTEYKNESAILIFIENNIDKRSRVYKAIKAYGKIVTFPPLSEKELIIWHSNIMKKKNLYLSSKDAVYLFRICGGDMDTILRETEKLCAYKKEGKVFKEDIDTLCTKTSEVKIFDLIDAIGEKDVSVALRIYNELLSMKETPIAILSLITRQMRLILKSSLLKRKGYSEADIANKLNERQFAIKIYLSQARNFSLDVLENATLDAVSCDTQIKSGIVDSETSIETFIIKYTN